MNKKFTVAVLGCGSRGLTYTENMFPQNDKYEIVSLCDPNPAQIEKMKKVLPLRVCRSFWILPFSLKKSAPIFW